MWNRSIIVGTLAVIVAGPAIDNGRLLSSQVAPPLFLEAAASAGLTFTHDNGSSGDFQLPEIMGAGVALFDYDRDEDLDVFLVQGGSTSSSRLFRNDLTIDASGRRALRFTDATARAGVGLVAQGMGAATGDYDGDADLDLVVTTFGETVLYRNNGNGTFANVSAAAGIRSSSWGTGAAFLDFDRDGRLDLFVTQYVSFTVAGNQRCHDPSGARDYCSPKAYPPLRSRLFRNLGGGRFGDVSESAGIAKASGNGMGVSVGDYNGDGWLDLYVANDATPNHLWINRRNGTFADEGFLSGAAVNAAGSPEGSMGIASADADRDGDEDLFVTNLAGETHVLYTNMGRGLFEDSRTQAGLGAPTAASTGFGTGWFDYDHDGWLDLFFASGGVTIVPGQRGQPRPYRMASQLFRSNGAGRYTDVSAAAGGGVSLPDVSRGAAFGDIDNDGDVDVVVTTNDGPVKLLVNETSRSNQWARVKVEQNGPNRLAFGAWVGLERSGQSTLWRRVGSDGSYLSANDIRLHFGLGPSPAIAAFQVQWPDGARERWTSGLAAGRTLTLTRGRGVSRPSASPAAGPGVR